MRPVFHLLAALLLTAAHPAIAAAEPAELDASQIRSAIGYLQSGNPAQRAATFKACRERGESFRDTYRKMLGQARDHHAREFSTAANNQLGVRAPAGQMLEAWQTWQSSSKRAREFVQKDHNKQQSKLNEMDRLFASAESDWKSMLSLRDRSGTAADTAARRIEDAAAALREISRELEWCRNPEREPKEPSLADLEKEFGLGSRASEFLVARAALASADAALKAAHARNEGQKWAEKRVRDFARILNDRRAALGLRPLLLNENLSKACRLHSEEMVRLNYFSHDSPVAENRSFVMRARKAGFDRARGECIYMGSTDPAAAEQAWWYSCGHRLINYATGPDTLGLGIHNTHWTLNTGSSGQ